MKKSVFTSYDELPLLLNVKQLAELLGVSDSSVYELSQEDDFPSLRIGKRIVIPKEELRKWIRDTEYGDFGLPVPDLNIFLDVPIGFVEQKLESSRAGDDRDYLAGGSDIHEADIEFQKRVRDVYLRQCEEDPGFIRIDCSDPEGRMLPPDAIFSSIVSAINTL